MKVNYNENSVWNPDLPISHLPTYVRDLFIKESNFLAEELFSKRLEVTLIPAPEPKFQGHKIRIAESHNPDWYSDLYFRCNIRRPNLMRALHHIEHCTDMVYKNGSKYNPFNNHSRMRQLIFERLTQGHDGEGGYNPPIEDICEYFGVIK